MNIKRLENDIKLLKEYLEEKEADQPLTIWNGIQILALLLKTLEQINRVDDMLDRHIDATNAY